MNNTPLITTKTKNGDIFLLNLKQIDPIDVPPPQRTQSPDDKNYVPAWLLDGNTVSYKKYGVWNKCKINRLTLEVYQIS